MHKLKITFVILAVLGLGAFLVLQRLRPENAGALSGDVKNRQQQGQVVVAFGDGLAGAEGMPQPLAALSSREVLALGRDGETTTAAVARLDEVLALKPNYVVVALGAEDLRQHVTLDETMAALETVLRRLVDSGALVAYVPIEVPGIGDNWLMAIHGLCTTHGVLWLEGATQGLWPDAAALDAARQLDESARQQLASRIYAHLKPLL